MTITQLQYVLAVAEHKNFTQAAEKCFVTQPTLSMQIQKIEEELDIIIFDRTKKPIQLTEVGKKIVEQAKNIVNEADRIQDIVDQEKGFVGGEFRIGIIPTVMPTLLPMFLNNFIKKYPKVKLIIEELNTNEIITKLKNGHLDAAIAATPLEEEKIKEVVLYYEPFMVYVPESHSKFNKAELEIGDLNVDEILLLQDGHCFRDGILNLCKNKNTSKENKFQLESGSFETLIRLANEGLGVTLLPYLHTLELSDKEKLKLRHFKDPKPSREVSLLIPKNELKIHIIDALRNVISGVLRGAIAFQNVEIISPLSKK
ncbi:DNA-binding transcriptional regulator OxyR [Flavobacterium columnare NBRC 100251 = ATCC 23463]|uniref:LysR family transcriptional regulator n=2 Tax=Flavobacterium columnare TaxID=996 RepID=G8X860_FLACA|nr:LysR substrate-binding domain-containing protein [Flavobacterium columnare]AEW84997.1 LysR family transcriptional regulator [Flavobacterium columnare ATCC 49512]AMO19343.1 LysR family transcriptional regulator [Flavobacterium columnare]ANO49229.1 LysR family transcriptional regulator [Flavobacterium columnare]APT22782.1 hydrogen peroxide-inducible genes activator [Flavobacterium columnare]AUX17283.1 transcriptional regulator [Flavobacterium columnare]